MHVLPTHGILDRKADGVSDWKKMTKAKDDVQQVTQVM